MCMDLLERRLQSSGNFVQLLSVTGKTSVAERPLIMFHENHGKIVGLFFYKNRCFKIPVLDRFGGRFEVIRASRLVVGLWRWADFGAISWQGGPYGFSGAEIPSCF